VLPRLGLILLALLLVPASASAAPRVQHLHFKYGPVTIQPGQNTISIDGDKIPRPKVSGWIVGFRPNLRRPGGSVPRVDVIHLHHAVWLINGRPTFAAGEEKTRVKLPRGFGWRYSPDDKWLLNHMIHNLLPNRDKVYITYDIDFVPDSSPAAKKIHQVKTLWLDVEAGKAYPVFDVHRGSGRNGRFTYPDDQPGAYGGGPARNTQVVPRDGVLVGTAGHLHPGGLYTDLKLTRGGRTVNLFRSKAHYWEPAGAVSWDVAMTATTPKWRVKVKRGDVLSVSATYDSKRASWYESMGIDPVAFAPGVGGGVDPFSAKLDKRGKITHGHLRENRNHGGDRSSLPDPRKLPDGPTVSGGEIDILSFRYAVGDLSLGGAGKNPPVVQRGQSVTFHNLESGKGLYHSITSCKAPCTGKTGIAYPLADSSVQFESNTLGRQIPAAGSDEWTTPPNLKPGTYTYFCRIHPFMRGAFRVK
jgi:plastocyanin